MNHLHLLIPDLFLPQDIAAKVCADLRLSAMEKLLARSTKRTSAIDGLEGWLCEMFAAEGVAPVRALADGLAVSEGCWLCADPVNMQLHRSQMVLQPDVQPSAEEAAALCAALNAHFEEIGLRFHAPHPQRWYMCSAIPPQVAMHPLSRVAWRDVKPFQPQGTDAMHWQRIATEAQMLLYEHPVNQAREARGEMSINSLWWWGGGRAAQLKKAFDAVGGDSALVGAFAHAAGVPQIASLPDMLEGKHESGLWVCTSTREASQRGDFYAWREAVQRVEQEYAQPLLKAMQSGDLQRLTLEVVQTEGAQCFELTRGAAWKLWRAARPLARYAV